MSCLSKQQQILLDVVRERARQDKLWGTQRNPSLEEWMTILVEEVGEVAREIQNINNGDQQAKARYVDEMIQVAAVAVASIEFMK